MGNRARIIEETRVLMNEHGAQSIGTTQIAEALKISPGNLYYHFKNKEEIVRILFDEVEQGLRDLVKDGNMTKPRGRNGFRSVALNTWLVWTNWIRYKQTISPTQLVTRENLAEGVTQIFDVLNPYLDPDFERAARRVLMRDLSTRSTDG